MANVSKKPLKEETQDKIEKTFADFVGALTADEADDFYRSFFTESEQIMLTKRLAIIILLTKGAPYAHIATVLNVSPATVRRIDNWKKDGRYDEFMKIASGSEDGFADRLWTLLRILIEENIHHYGATGWRWLDRAKKELDL